MAAPGMIRTHGARAGARGLERAAKVREGELRHAIAVTLHHHFIVKGSHRLTQLGEQVTLASGAIGNSRIRRRLVGVSIKAAERAEEYLTFHAQAIISNRSVADLDQLSDLFQLVADVR